MRLNKKLRDKFVNAIMEGVPLVDNHEKARKMLQAAALKECPVDVRTMYRNENLRVYLRKEPYWFSTYAHGNFTFSLVVPRERQMEWKPDADTRLEASNLIAEQHDSKTDHKSLQTMLTEMVKCINTTEKLREAFPEWASLVPEDERPANLPAPTDLMARFKAAGWKKKRKAA